MGDLITGDSAKESAPNRLDGLITGFMEWVTPLLDTRDWSSAYSLGN